MVEAVVETAGRLRGSGLTSARNPLVTVAADVRRLNAILELRIGLVTSSATDAHGSWRAGVPANGHESGREPACPYFGVRWVIQKPGSHEFFPGFVASE